MSREEIIRLLQLEGEAQAELHRKASRIRDGVVSNSVYVRGLVEFSNVCLNDCFYCGIRKSNSKIKRYTLSTLNLMDTVRSIAEAGLSSVVLQSGERRDREFLDHGIRIVGLIKETYPLMSITLSVGEQTRETYKAFYDAGAERYLLRIETSNKAHYRMLHPRSMRFDERLQCLHDLKDIGFQVGTGVIINSPFQTLSHLAEDILFFKSLDVDMCGMGPYIPHSTTPLVSMEYSPQRSLNLGLNMIAVLRMVMPDINIASTTALAALSPHGKESGILAGANVIMLQSSPTHVRGHYRLYNDKPTDDAEITKLVNHWRERLTSLGLRAERHDPGDSFHYRRRAGSVSTR